MFSQVESDDVVTGVEATLHKLEEDGDLQSKCVAMRSFVQRFYRPVQRNTD